MTDGQRNSKPSNSPPRRTGEPKCVHLDFPLTTLLISTLGSQHAEIVRLQSEVDTLTQDKMSTESRLESVRQVQRAQETQLEEALSRVTTLKAEITHQTTTFRAESETQKRLAELMDRRNDESRRRVEEIEREWDGVVSKATATESKLRDDLDKERKRADDLEQRVEELRFVNETMRHGGAAGEFGTPGRASTPAPGTPGGANPFFLSPAATLASRLQKSGRSYTEIYSDFVRVSEELTSQKEESRRLETALTQILTDIEERVRKYTFSFSSTSALL